MSSIDDYIISPSTLATTLSSPSPSKVKIIPLCAAWFLPTSLHTGLSVFQKSRIPKASFFDLDAVKDPNSPYPHMLPSGEDFATAMRHLGIRREDRVVVYDSAEQGLFSAPRVGWMFKVMGHPRVNVLNSFKKWVEEGYPLESGPLPALSQQQQQRQQQQQGSEPVKIGASAEREATDYPVPEVDTTKTISFEEVKTITSQHTSDRTITASDPLTPQILDARPSGRFTGTDPEPRPGLSSGHIPGSISVPFSSLLDPKSGTLLPAAELRKIFAAKGVDPKRPVISSCGTGVTAAVVDAALEDARYLDEGFRNKRRVYDGSWTEWAMRVQEKQETNQGMIVKG